MVPLSKKNKNKATIKQAAKGKNKNGLASTQPRTLNTTQLALAKPILPSKKMMSEYLHCRLSPFTSTGRGSIPDGSNNNYNVLDIVMFDTFSVPANQRTYIQTLPTFPCSAMITTPGASTMVVNGLNVNCPTTTSINSTSTSVPWTPISVLSPYKQSSPQPPGNIFYDPYFIQGLRVVSVGYRLVYAGETQTCAGTITVTPNEAVITPQSMTSAAVTTAQVLDIAGAVIAVGAGTPIWNLDAQVTAGAMTRDSVTLRPEQGALIVPKHKTGVFKINTMGVTGSVLLCNTDVAGTAGIVNAIPSANASIGSDTFDASFASYDNDWSTVQIEIQGGIAPQQFRWETYYCFEVNPRNGSVFSQSVLKSSPNKPEEIKLAQTITGKQPVATTLTQ